MSTTSGHAMSGVVSLWTDRCPGHTRSCSYNEKQLSHIKSPRTCFCAQPHFPQGGYSIRLDKVRVTTVEWGM